MGENPCVDPDVARLADALDELGAFLHEHAEPGWASWVSEDAARVRRDDGYGVTHFLSAFSGMGSLNDLMFHPANGNAADIREAEALQQRFDRLRSTAFVLASALRRDAEA